MIHKPVVTSTQAYIWRMLRSTGINDMEDYFHIVKTILYPHSNESFPEPPYDNSNY
jgi:hypothetical protein